MFKYIIGFTSFILAGCAAFFSVKGIALLFAASFWSVGIMAASLELAKLASASYLYRYWQEINKILRNYMLSAVILLMSITSLGIFGFLSDAFQRNFSQYTLNITRIQALKSQQTFITSQVDFNKNKLKDLIELQKTYQTSLDSAVKQDVTTTKTSGGGLFSSGKTEKITDQKLLDTKNKIIEGSQQNINSLFNQIQIVTSELQNLETKTSNIAQEIMVLEADNTKGEIGTFKFVAEAFNMKIENAVRLFIILIVIVFDPLAVALVIAYNKISTENNMTIIVPKSKEIVKNIKPIAQESKEVKKTSNEINQEVKIEHDSLPKTKQSENIHEYWRGNVMYRKR